MPFDAVPEKQHIVLLVPDIADTITRNRVESFLEAGHALNVLGFRRSRYKRPDPMGGPHIELGGTVDARYGQRLMAVFGALPKLFFHRHLLRRADALYSRNLDQLILAMFARIFLRARAPIFYEVLDIQPIFVGKSLSSHLVRLIERVCLRSVRLLIVSSGGFHANYYQPVQNYRGRWFLLENKLPASAGSLPRNRQRLVQDKMQTSNRLVVGYFGLIRGEATLNLIEKLAQRLGDRVVFRFAGIVTSVDPDYFKHVVENNENIVYDGEYQNPADLPQLYDSIDFAWALDLENVQGNSRWLMPCRFYEAGYFGVPCLVARDFEIGRAVEEADCGWAFEAPYEDVLVDFFRTLTAGAYGDKRRRLSELPASEFVAGKGADGLALILR